MSFIGHKSRVLWWTHFCVSLSETSRVLMDSKTSCILMDTLVFPSSENPMCFNEPKNLMCLGGPSTSCDLMDLTGPSKHVSAMPGNVSMAFYTSQMPENLVKSRVEDEWFDEFSRRFDIFLKISSYCCRLCRCTWALLSLCKVYTMTHCSTVSLLIVFKNENGNQ